MISACAKKAERHYQLVDMIGMDISIQNMYSDNDISYTIECHGNKIVKILFWD